MSDRRWSDLAAAYAIDALDAEERAEFETRLATDAELRREVDAYREVAADLAAAAPTAEAPAALRERILAEARKVRPLSPERRPGSRGTALPWVAAAAAAGVALVLGVRSGRIAEERADLRTRLTATEARLAERDSLLATFLGPDVRTAALSATDQPPSARLFWNTRAGTVVIAAFDLPPAPAGRTYQLWGIAPDSDPVSLGTFQTASDGTAIVQRAAPTGAAFQLGAVTEEPAGGSPQPTSAPFLVGSWTDAP